MSDVFVSYKAEDRRRVEPLVRALEQDGLSVWWDAHIGGGDQWRETILKNLEASRCVLVIWSKRSAGPEGEFVRDEATRAKRRNAYLPVRIDKVDPPLGFGEMQAISLQSWKGDRSDPRYHAVLEAARNRLGMTGPRPVAADRPGVSRRTALAGGAAIAAAAAGAGAWWLTRPTAAAANSIAVMPFANLSGDPGQTYFSDGIAEELRSALARIAGLKVVARTSSEAVRNEDAKSAAHKLAVSNILTGSVRRSPSLIRVSAQLVDGGDGTERWSQDYDRPAGDALQIQSDIAERVAAALALQLVPAAGGRLVLGGTTNPQAHDLFLQGLATRQGQHSEANLRRAVDLFNSALALDPQYADAYARKATTLCELASGFSRSETEMQQGFTSAAVVANRALALAPDLPSARAALAAVSIGRMDFAAALSEFRKAASATSADAAILGDCGRFLGQLGLPDEAYPIGRRVIAIDPLNARSYSVQAVALFYSRRFREALPLWNKILTLSPGSVPPLSALGDAMLLLGNYAEARSTYAQMPTDDVFRVTGEGMLAERTGDHAASSAALEKLERLFGGAAAYQIAQLHAQRHDLDAAFAGLDRALKVRDPGLVILLTDPFLDPLRADPRFRNFRSKINFPPGLPA